MTCSPPDFHVSHSPVPDHEKERKMTATSGRKCFVSLEKLNPLGLLVKTLLESQVWYSQVMKLKWEVTKISSMRVTRKRKCVSNLLLTESATILNVLDIPSSRLLYRLVPSARHTGGTGFGLLPTVQTQGLKVCNNGKTEFMNLAMLPTPTASCFQTGTVKERNDGISRTSQLNHLISQTVGKNSRLNPLYVAEMMGFPINYLVLPFLDG